MARGEYLLTQSGLQVQTLLNKVQNPAMQPEATERLITAGGVLAGLAPKYEKPSGGIPASDLTEAVQVLLAKVGAGNAAFGQGYGTCTPPSSGVACEVTLQNYLRLEGGYIAVKVSARDMPASATLNVNDMGAQPVIWRGSPLSGGVVRAGDLAVFVYAAGAYQLVAKDTPFTYDGHTFFGTCATEAATAAKEVTISGFNLGLNVAAVVTFTNAVSVPDATLNIRNTGAKPIYINGAALQPGVIRAGMTAMMVYDGTHYNIVGLMGLEQSATDPDLYVDMGLPSGVMWAKANIDVKQANGFAASPYQYEASFFSWGNTFGVNPKPNSTGGTNAFDNDYNWGGANNREPWYDGQPYGSTPGVALTANISPSMDAARAALGAPWRMPMTDEFKELFDNIDYLQADGETVIPASTTNKLVTVSSIVGIYLRSKINGNKLFFPCAGDGIDSRWLNRGTFGSYRSSSFVSERNALLLSFGSTSVNPQYEYGRFGGIMVRPVL